LANIIYSSGTTGTPKGIAHTHGARWQFGCMGSTLGMKASSRTLLTTPPHSNGTWLMLLSTLLVGGTIILVPAFDANLVVQLIERHRPTHALLVPTMCRTLLDRAGIGATDFGSFECVLTAGAPMPRQMKEDLRRLTHDHLYELWGLTESLATVISPGEMASHPDSVGRPTPGSELRTIDSNGRENTGQGPGEIVGRSNHLMRGYWNRPDANREITWTSDDNEIFLRTGDIGEIDDDGYLILRGRAKDMIISGGFNIFPVDLEAVLLESKAVRDAAVVGCADEKWGETPVAFVILHEHAVMDSEALKIWANARLAKYQRISKVILTRVDFPRNTLGKVLKNELSYRLPATTCRG
jgi:acyl-CoA synthetase (AMP-forming)/AMP-acid ligase II